MKNLFLNFIGISLAITTLISCSSGSASESSGDSELYNNAIKKMQEVIKNDELNGREPKYELDLNGDGIKEEFIKVDLINYALFTKKDGNWKQISSENIEMGAMSPAPQKLSTKSDGWNDFSIESMVGVGDVYKWDGAKYIASGETIETAGSDEGYIEGDEEDGDIEEEDDDVYSGGLVSRFLEGTWYDIQTKAKISISIGLEEGFKSYGWDETYDGAVESMVCILSKKCTDDRMAENDDKGSYIIMYDKDVVLCYKAEINQMADGIVELMLTDTENKTKRVLIQH